MCLILFRDIMLFFQQKAAVYKRYLYIVISIFFAYLVYNIIIFFADVRWTCRLIKLKYICKWKDRYLNILQMLRKRTLWDIHGINIVNICQYILINNKLKNRLCFYNIFSYRNDGWNPIFMFQCAYVIISYL